MSNKYKEQQRKEDYSIKQMFFRNQTFTFERQSV